MGSSLSLTFFLIIFLLTVTIVFSTHSSLSKADLNKKYKISFHRREKEEDLEECQDVYSPCNIIRNPFFFPFLVKRICRCKNKGCPDTFEVKRSLDTVFINNREQLKFCDELPKCHGGSGILRVGAEDDVPYHLNCFCPSRRRYWRALTHHESLESYEESTPEEHPDQADHETKSFRPQYEEPKQRNATTVIAAIPTKLFKCEKMEPCRQSSCGSFKTDLYATYQNCTCSINSLCLPSRNPTSLSEVMSKGATGRISMCVRSHS